jgi:hypothetical protein
LRLLGTWPDYLGLVSWSLHSAAALHPRLDSRLVCPPLPLSPGGPSAQRRPCSPRRSHSIIPTRPWYHPPSSLRFFSIVSLCYPPQPPGPHDFRLHAWAGAGVGGYRCRWNDQTDEYIANSWSFPSQILSERPFQLTDDLVILSLSFFSCQLPERNVYHNLLWDYHRAVAIRTM